MQYVVLLLSVFFGYLAHQVWVGVFVGALFCWVVIISKKYTQESDWAQQLAELEDELKALKQRVHQLEAQQTTATPQPIPKPEPETAMPPAAVAVTPPPSVMPAASTAPSHWAPEPAMQASATRQPASPAMPLETPAEHTAATRTALQADVATPSTKIEVLRNRRQLPPAEQPAVEQPAVERPIVEQPIVEQPTVERSIVERSIVEQPAVERPTVKPRAVEQQPAEAQGENPILAWLTGGNVLLKAGVVILFLGLAFLLRLASEHIHISIGARYVGVALAGLAASAAGLKLQQHQREYGLVLQGFGIAVMYLTSLAAVKLHFLLPASTAFALMVLLVVLMALLAVRQNALILAQVALIGGMAAPILLSDGSSHDPVLFAYLALLNTGVALIAWFKAWRSLNLTGFAGTFLIGAMWGAEAYTPQYFASTEPFLLFHWLLYTLIACLFAHQQWQEKPLKGHLKTIPDNASLDRIWQSVRAYGLQVDLLDSTLLFGTALAAFALQYQLVSHWEHAAAWSALGFAAVYALFALWFSRRHPELAVLKQAFIMLALVFTTLAIPLAFEQQWTAAAWTLQAALIYVFALKQRLPQTRLLALAVYGMAALTQLSTYRTGTETLLQGSILGTVLAASGGLLMYVMWDRQRREDSARWERNLQTAVLTAAVLFVSLLPLLVFGARGSMAAGAVLTALWAFCQRQQPQTVFSCFAALCGIGVIGLMWQQYAAGYGADIGPFYLLNLLNALLLATAAFWLDQADWLKSEDLPEDAPEAWTQAPSRQINRMASALLLALALMAGFGSIQLALSAGFSASSSATVWTLPLLFACLSLAAKRLAWPLAQQAALAFTVLFSLHCLTHILDLGLLNGLLLLAVATALHLFILQMQNLSPEHTTGAHLIGLLLLAALWTYFVGHQGSVYLDGVWAQLAWAAVPALLWLLLYHQSAQSWMQQHAAVYWQFGSAACAVYLAGWLLHANIVTPHAPDPLPYLPVLNPLEIVMIALLWQAYRWLEAWMPEHWSDTAKRQAAALPLLLAFITLSAGVMRAWHFFGNVWWDITTLLASFGLQASLSIVWSSAAIALMVSGNQQGQRSRWLIGAALMGVVVVKLFLVELGNSGGIARIVSFIVVGLLLLLVGWFAPVPPKEGADTSDDEA